MRRRKTKQPYQFPRLRILIFAIAILAIITIAVDAYHGIRARSAITAAQAHLELARQAVAADDIPNAQVQLTAAGKATRQAAAATSGIAWRFTAHIPVFGETFATAQALANSADVIARQVLPPTLNAAEAVSGHHLKNADGAVNLTAIGAAEPVLAKAMSQLQQQYRLAMATKPAFLQRPRAKYLNQLIALNTQLAKPYQISQELPAMLGNNGIRRYFVGFLTNAEARATGGFLGAYGILKADHGHLSFERFGIDSDLRPADAPVVDLGAEFNYNYGYTKAAQTWTESTVDPHFPDVGAIWVGLWKAQTGEQLNGAIAIDPFGLAALLNVTGPVVTSTGPVVTAGNVVPLVENQAYITFGDANQLARKNFLLQIAEGASHAITSQQGNTTQLLDALKQAAKAKRIRAYASIPGEQQLISGTDVAGEMPKPGHPLAYLIVQNGAGNKMEYYLKRSVTYLPAACGKPAVVTVKLTNTLTDPANLPGYITGHVSSVADFAAGTAVEETTLYLNGASTLAATKIDGVQRNPRQTLDKGLTGLSWEVPVLPGQTRTIQVTVTNDKPGTPTIVDQPLVIPQTDTVLPERC